MTTSKSVKTPSPSNLTENPKQCNHCPASAATHHDRIFIKDQDTNLYICSNCITDFSMALEEISRIKMESSEVLTEPPLELPDPQEIYQYLCQDIIGQETAKKDLAIAVAHHYRRIYDQSDLIGKSNILMAGPTGTGKTELARSIANFLEVPFAIADATTFTAKGFAGEDVESIIQRLLINANWDVSAAEKGIVFIDEIDKINKKDSDQPDIGSLAVQQGLLKIMESDSLKITHPDSPPHAPPQHIFINTSKILFICAGAFVGLDKLISGNQNSIGIAPEIVFASSPEIRTKHLEKFGFIPEFIGRLPIVTTTQKLSESDLVKIMTEPRKSILRQYTALFAADKVEIKFSEDFCLAVAQESLKENTGARGIKSVIEKRMKDVFFNVRDYKDKQLIITSTDIKVIK